MDVEVEVVLWDEVWAEWLSRHLKEEISLCKSGRSKSVHIPVASLSDKLYKQVLDDFSTAKEYAKVALISLGLSDFWVRFVKHPLKIPVKSLKSDKLGKFVSIEGTIRSIKDPQPYILTAAFKCLNCEHIEYIPQTEKMLEKPDILCCSKPRFILDVSHSTIVDSQSFKLQEQVDGGVSSILEVLIFGDEVGVLNAGDRVVVNGILKAYRNQKDALALSLYFEGNSIEVTDREFSEISISEEDEERILEFAKSGNLLSDFVAAIAPTIYGFSEVKEAVALQIFGGTSLKYADGTTKRGDIHVLLVGDPGISKSKLLQSVLAICPRGILVSGKSSSTAGLTATAVKDSEGIWTLEAGAVVLADNGQLLIDEVDKMRDEDTSALHQALEQQQVAIAKAGIVTTLNSRCSLLAAMNPKLGRFDDIADLAEQINLPPTLLSRFDLIFLLLDHPDADKDKRIATHIINGAAITGDIQFLRKYVAYAKRNIFPKLTEEAKTKITEYYCEVRGLSSRGKSVPLTARQLEALVRLCEASARMRLSNEVSIEDAEVATRVLDTCLRGIAYDAATGTFDIDKAHNKMSRNSREKAMDLLSICKTLSQDNPYGWPIETLCDICTLKPRADLEKELQKLIDNNLLFMPKTGKYKIV